MVTSIDCGSGRYHRLVGRKIGRQVNPPRKGHILRRIGHE